VSYQGLVAEIPLGPDGLTGNKNLSQIRVTQLLRALNVTYEAGTVQKEGGTTKYNSSAISSAPTILAGWDWHPTTGTQRMVVVTSAGDILRDDGDGSFGTTLKSSLTVSDTRPFFVDGGAEDASENKKLFIFTGQNVVQFVNGDASTSGDLTTPPSDWSGANQPTIGVLHEKRLWGAGNGNDPHRWYYTDPGDHEVFTGGTTGTVAVYPGEGDGITAGISYKGLLITFKKPRGVYAVDTSSSTLANWRVVKISDGVGCYSPHGVIYIDDDVLFLDQSANPQLISAVSAFGDVSSRNIGIPQEIGTWIRENSNLGQLQQVKGIYYADKREAHFSMAGVGATTNTRRLVIDLNRLDLARFRWNDRDTAESMWMKRDSNDIPRPVYGDNAGFVRLLDQETRSHDASGYNGEFQTPHTDLSYLDPKFGTKRKNFDFLEMVVEPKGNWNLNVDVVIDADITETITFNMGQSGGDLGTFVLGTDVLAGDSVLNKKRQIHGSGRRISLVGRNNGTAQDFSVAKMYLHFRPSDERI